MSKPSDEYLNKYGYAENVSLSDYQLAVKKAFKSLPLIENNAFEIHGSSQFSTFGHIPSLVIFRPAQTEQEFDIGIEIGLDRKNHIFRWALDDNWDEEWNDGKSVNELLLNELPNLEIKHQDKHIAYLLKAIEYALSSNIKLKVTNRNDYPYAWEAEAFDGKVWITLSKAMHPSLFNIFRKHVSVHEKTINGHKVLNTG